jgi:hypothetical protein
MMKRFVVSCVAALFSFVMVAGPSAGAATSYSNCTALHKRYEYGVAKSKKAARYQVKTGHYKPHVSKAVYRANSDLDADTDGTACEVSK